LASPKASSTSSIGFTGGKHSDMMARSNVSSAASLGDLVELLDEVSFGSASTTNTNASDRVPRHSKMETIDNEGDDVEESANSGIGKVDSYLDLCTNKTYLARHQVCMADITQKTREDEQVNVEDCSNDEEESYDENGNVKINVDRFEPHQRRSVRDATGTINAANAGTTTARAPMASASVASMEVSI
jgi:hypothetical protein